MNRKFKVVPAEEKDAHRPLPKETRLSDVFCFEEERRVNNDWTIQYQGRFFQIQKENKVLPRAGQKVTIRRDLEGILTLHYKGQGVSCEEITARPQRPEPVKESSPRSSAHRPGPRHPWRAPFNRIRQIESHPTDTVAPEP